MTFWDFFWLMLWAFLYIGYLIVLFQIVLDVFRDDELSGWGKAGWIVALLVLPAITALIYIGVRGKGMGRRQRGRFAPVPEDSAPQVINAPTAADQIGQAKTLLDSGAISAQEYEQLKARALGESRASAARRYRFRLADGQPEGWPLAG